MSIKVRQSASPAGKDWWKWSVWLEANDEEFSTIDSVKYTLHPTFPNPVRVVKTRATKYRLTSSGWGEFKIYIEICHKDGRVKTRTHWLKLEEGQQDRIIRKVKKGVEKIFAKNGEKDNAANEERRAVFISSSAADMPFAKTLGEALKEKGVEVLTADESSSLPWEILLNSQIQRADNAIFVLSDSTSRWLTSEIKAVRKHDLPITTVVIADRPAKIPPDLNGPGVSRLKIKQVPTDASEEEMRDEMRSIAQRLISKIFPRHDTAMSE